MKSTSDISAKPSLVKVISEKLLGFDAFSLPFNMTFNGGKTSLGTWTGTALSIVAFMVISSYMQ